MTLDSTEPPLDIANTMPQEVDRDRHQDDADDDLPPNHTFTPRCTGEEPAALAQVESDDAGNEEQRRCGRRGESEPQRTARSSCGGAGRPEVKIPGPRNQDHDARTEEQIR